jgi:hypothetical protein
MGNKRLRSVYASVGHLPRTGNGWRSKRIPQRIAARQQTGEGSDAYFRYNFASRIIFNILLAQALGEICNTVFGPLKLTSAKRHGLMD